MGTILARDQITVVDMTDIDETRPYYISISNTESAPSKPTTYPPTGWSTTEPELDLSKKVYVCWYIKYSNNTFDYSDVSVFSSYEAAKAAKNTADNNALSIEYITNNYTTLDKTDELISLSAEEITTKLYGDPEDSDDKGEIGKIWTNINASASSIDLIAGTSDQYNAMISTFSFELGKFSITTTGAEIHSEQGPDFYKFIDKADNMVLGIDRNGTTALQANVTGQVGIGYGSVDNYIDQWAIRRGAGITKTINNVDTFIGYNLDFVWLGG